MQTASRFSRRRKILTRAPKLVALSAQEPVRFVRTTFRAAKVPVWQGGKPFKSFSIAPEKGRRYVLDLGDVRELANVRLNGRAFGCLWESPCRIDITEGVMAGKNDLEIEVVNTWPNRLIGDAIARKGGAAEPLSEKGPWPLWVLGGKSDSGTGIYTWSNWLDGWHADDALLPAGLLGPVRILSPLAKCN